MNKNHRWAPQLVVLVFFFATLGYAQSPTPAPADNTGDLLEVLHAKGILTQQEYDALKQRVVTAAPAPIAQETAVPAPQPDAKTGTPFVRMMEKGIGLHIGEVDLKFSGELNAFYVHDRPAGVADGTLAGLASGGAVPNSSVRNGLLPSNFSISVSTQQKGFDVAATFGFYPGLNNLQTGGLAGTTFGGVNLAPGNPTGFGVSGIDFRQQFVTVGRPHLGTFKFGRDIGLFGQEAILNDMTLLGAGTTNGNVAPGSVTLGRIGIGYVYTDFMPQISYMTPTFAGLQAGVGIFTPLSDVYSTTLGLGGPGGVSATLTGHGQPMYQAKLTYTIPTKGPVKANLWLNGITQSLQANLGQAIAGSTFNPEGIATSQSVRAAGVDGGVKLTAGPASLLAYGYNGRGIGQEGLFFLAVDPSGRPREFRGGYVQGTYTLAKKTTFGFSYGLSHVGLTPYDAVNLPSILKANSSEVVQMRYALTKWVTPLAEYTHTRTTAHNSSAAAGTPITTEDSVAIGAIVFF
jgi:predicted porin